MKARDLISQPPSICIYGAAGTGKTALVSQAAGGYMLDFDNGMRTALMLKDEFTDLRQALEFDVFVDRIPERPAEFVRAKQKLMQISQLQRADKWPYDAIIIDSLTGLCRATMLHVLACSGDVMGIPKIQHYLQAVTAIESILTILRSLKVPVLVTAHETVIDTDTSSLIRIMSITKRHGMNKIPWLFDEVLYMKVEPARNGKISYVVSGRATSSIAVRTRSGILDDIIINDIGLRGLFERVGFTYGK